MILEKLSVPATLLTLLSFPTFWGEVRRPCRAVCLLVETSGCCSSNVGRQRLSCLS